MSDPRGVGGGGAAGDPLARATGDRGPVGSRSETIDLRDPVEVQAERPLGELMSELGNNIGELVTAQVKLATAEIRDEARGAVRLGELWGSAALMGYFAVLILSFAAAWGLAEVMAPGLAFLIVGLVWAIGAGVLFVIARNAQKEADPVPHETVDTIKEDVQWFKQQMS